ncbi:sensor histidine kinase [Mucilaginibacter sp.]|uniref:sensor histidine kinase n=1 Tax=Mucilaginibacter sp. TaxID=1882438 RepID=UPI003D0D7EF8
METTSQQKAELLLEETRSDFEQFAYVVSHDLQEQVRNITNYTGLIEKHPKFSDDEEIRFYMGVVTGSANKLNEQLAELLTYSRIGRNKKKETISIRKVLGDVIMDMEAEVAGRQAKIYIGDMPEVNGNTSEMKILFQNLLNNSLKFSGSLPPEITINCQNKNKAWEFSIKDNGIGIVENHLHKIFTMFQRLNPEEEYPGNGAGLAICKKIISWHNGKIWAESEPGKGSVFYFTLPTMELPA